MMFSGDGENLFAGISYPFMLDHTIHLFQGSDTAGSHEIFGWDVAAGGQYLRTMENGKEPLVDLDVRLVNFT